MLMRASVPLDTLDPVWLTQQRREDRSSRLRRTKPASGELDSTKLAVLADVLEEARCTDSAIRDHGRGPGPHVRGCWAIDAILQKG